MFTTQRAALHFLLRLVERDGVQTLNNLSVDRDLSLIGQTRKQFTLIDSLMND